MVIENILLKQINYKDPGKTILNKHKDLQKFKVHGFFNRKKIKKTNKQKNSVKYCSGMF